MNFTLASQQWLPRMLISMTNSRCWLTFQALDGLGPGYLKDCLLQHHPICELCSAGEALLSVPLVGEFQWVSMARRAFLVVTLIQWNSLTRETRMAPLLLAFKHAIKTVLFNRVFYELPLCFIWF